MASETETPKRRVPLWVKLLLGVSLALNLAVIGGAVGIASRFKNGPGGPAVANYALPYVLALPRDDRREIGRTVRAKSRGGTLPSRKDRRAGYLEMVSLLKAGVWDPEQASRVLDKQRDQTISVQIAAQAEWLKRIDSFSTDERRAYAERLEEFLKRGGKKRK